jgi:hypothetical protein
VVAVDAPMLLNLVERRDLEIRCERIEEIRVQVEKEYEGRMGLLGSAWNNDNNEY